MNKFRLIFILVLITICSASLLVPANSSAQTQPNFTSLYTNLKTECKAAFKHVGEGQDMPLLCKGFGGYKVYIYYSAFASQIGIIRPTKSELVNDPISLSMQELNYDQEGRKVEWRLANGKPFAVILRVSKYRDDVTDPEGGNPLQSKYKTGESLLVKGLKGYEHIDFTVDTNRTPNPNEKARELADSNYNKK